jgi:hypothetical protein
VRLYQILFRHYAPKDSEFGIKTFVLADDEVTIRDRIDAQFQFGAWKERDEDGPQDVYGDDYEVIGQELYLARMLRLRGEYNDPDHEVSDLYYGATQWGWDEGREITEALAVELIRLGIAQDWRQRSIGQ